MKRLRFLIVVLSGITLSACSSSTPVSPVTPAAAGGEVTARPSAAVPGVYTLTFLARVDGTLQEVSSLPVSSAELILQAHVTDSSGAAAGGGTVTFEYCSYKGPPNDITRADEAPKEACDRGEAAWARLQSMSVCTGTCLGLGTGVARMNFGIVRIPRDVGFRFRYSPKGVAISSGTSAERNFTWTNGSGD